MKKTLIITLHNGRELLRDLSKDPVKDQNGKILIGVPANDQHYATLCHFIALNGCTDTDVTNEMNYTHITPASIASVTVRFEKHLTANK